MNQSEKEHQAVHFLAYQIRNFNLGRKIQNLTFNLSFELVLSYFDLFYFFFNIGLTFTYR